MAASDRTNLGKKKPSIEDKLFPSTKHSILPYVGKIGARDFKYSNREFKDKDGQTKYAGFWANVFVLLSYMERAEWAKAIAINLLWLIQVEKTLVWARHNPGLPIPVLIQDPHGQWIEATPLQVVYAAGDCNPPNMDQKENNYGLVERLRSCFKNPAHADEQLAEWKKGSKKATAETMRPYVAAINATCQEVIEAKEISDDVHWVDVLTLPIFLLIDENFKKALVPNPNHVVRSGFLFSMEIFLHLIETFKANVNNDHVEDKTRPNLGGWWSRKSDALDAVVYPKLQNRSSRADLTLFKKGIGNVAEGQVPDRLDFTNCTPSDVAGIGSTHFFGFSGDEFAAARIPSCRVGRRRASPETFETCVKQKRQ